MDSIWHATLESFYEALAAPHPVPAGVTASTVTASLGVGLLVKALRITGKRPDIVEEAGRIVAQLRKAADDDAAAVREYMATRDSTKMETAVEIPMRAARAAVTGLDLCVQTAGSIRGLLAADVGAAASLLAGAAEAILDCADANMRTEENKFQELTEESKRLRARVRQRNETVSNSAPID